MCLKEFYRVSLFVIICLFIVSLNGREASASLKDMPARSSEEISYLMDRNIINGYPDGTFRPSAKVSRQEAITMVARALDLNGEQRKTTFTDVPASLYSSGYIQSAYDSRLLTLNSNCTFRPFDNMTRGEVAYFLQRAFGLTASGAVSVSDVSSSSDLYTAINAVITSGLSNGYPDGSYKPNNSVTREEFALFVARGLNSDYRVTYLGEPKNRMQVNVASWDVLNVRSGPSTNYQIVGSFTPGTLVDVYRYEGNWVYVSSGSIAGYVNAAYLQTPQTSANKKNRIAIDAGHGGSDPGAVGNGLQEKEINLSIALKVQKILEKKGINVVMTRTGDTALSLSRRVDIAVQNNADAFVSIHTNSAEDPAGNGTETYYSTAALSARAKDSAQLATFIQNRLYPALETRNRGVKTAGFQVIKRNPLPAALVELGFISNSSDSSKLGSEKHRNLAAEAIALGIVDYYNWKK